MKITYPFCIKKQTGGIIKQNPQDFIVEEVPLYKPSGNGSHFYIKIEKKDTNTIDIIKKLCQILPVKFKDIGYSGLKDKTSISYQWISILGDRVKEEDLKRIENIENVKILEISKHTNKLKVGHLLGNNFIIKIRKTNSEVFEEQKKLLKQIQVNGMPNYFGEQRFGKKNKNYKMAIKLLAEQTKIKKKWENKFYISALQSIIFNNYLKKRIETGFFNGLLSGDVVKKHTTGGLFIVEDYETDSKRFIEKEISPTGPIVGFKNIMPKYDSLKFEQEVLNEYGIDEEFIKNLRNKKIFGTRRFLRIFPKTEHFELIDDDTGLIKFFLPKGSYATIFLEILGITDISV